MILFVMTCAIMPYRDTNVRVLMLDQKMPLRFGSKLEKTLSTEVRDLMQGILNYDIKRRLNLPRIQQNSWVQKGGEAPPPPPPPKKIDEGPSSRKATSCGEAAASAPSPQAKTVMKELTDDCH